MANPDPLLDWLETAIEMEFDPDQRLGLMRLRGRLRVYSNGEKAWLRAAKEALAGNMRSLRNRVEMREAPPAEIVLSEEQSA